MGPWKQRRELSRGRLQTAVVAQERNVMVFAQKPEHVRHGVLGLAQSPPQTYGVLDPASKQLTEGFSENVNSNRQRTPRSL
jgi:hypothetical protein